MSVYADAASGYRDTTKWLTALVPVTAIATVGLTLGPALADAARESTNVGDFVSDNLAILVALCVSFLGLVLIVWTAARVLSVDPTDIGTLYSDKKAGPPLVKALGAGALAPYFLDQPSFDEALTALSAAQSADDDTKAQPLLDRLEPACEVLRQWAVFRVMRGRFTCFLVSFGVGATIVAAGIVLAAANLPNTSVIDKPSPVKVVLDQAATRNLDKATSCNDPNTVSFVAVAGTWEAPVLAVSGPGCTTASRWRPNLNHAVITPLG